VRILRPYGLGLVVLALAGCAARPPIADPPATTGQAPSGLAQARYQGPLRAPMTYPGLGIELRPPADLTPLTDCQQAYTAACGHGEALCQFGRNLTIVLADATLTNTSLTVSNPVYAVMATDVPCYPKGPAPSPGVISTLRSPSLCVEVSLVDANTGTFAYAASGTTP